MPTEKKKKPGLLSHLFVERTNQRSLNHSPEGPLILTGPGGRAGSDVTVAAAADLC